MLNLGCYLDAAANSYGETPCAILDDSRLSYREAADMARRVASALHAYGVQPGDRVAMMLPNVPQFIPIYYGILRAGAVVVPINCLCTHQEITHYLADSESVLFFCFEGFLKEGAPAFETAKACRRLVVVESEPASAEHGNGDSFEQMLRAAEPQFDPIQTMPDDTAVILYTSGTTGVPKGAELTHFNMFFNAYYSATRILELQPGEACLAALPLFHSFGQTLMMNASILTGATVTMLPRFDPRKAMQVIERDRVAVIALVPTMYFYLLNEPTWGNYDLSSLRVAVSGGAAMPAEVHARFRERYGINVLEGYGLSETSPVASFNPSQDAVKIGSIGTPIWGVEMAVEREDGSFADDDEVGEIVIRGHNIMKGYANQPEATREAMANGWFHSGDMGRRDSDGYFYIIDRKKDLIIRAGMNIYPREIEEVLYRHPKVLEAAVVGMPHSVRGEDVKVYVSPREGERLEEVAIKRYLREHTASYKWPRQVVVLPSLPKGPTGKILKRNLRDAPPELQ